MRLRRLACLIILPPLLFLTACEGSSIVLGNRYRSVGWHVGYGAGPWYRCCGYRGGRRPIVVVPPREVAPKPELPIEPPAPSEPIAVPLPSGGFGDDFGGGDLDFGVE